MGNKPKEKNRISALLRRVLLAILGLIIGLNVYLANANNVLGNKLPMPLGYGAAVVMSGSMEPTFSTGDLLLVRQSDQLQVGDIVVYQSGRSLVVHRVIGLDGDMVITQGDANNTADPPFEKGAILGTVAGRVPGAGVLVNALKSPLGMILLLVCAYLMTELPFRKQKQMDQKELDAIKDEIRRLKEEQKQSENQ